jgi:hypothetical protein
MDHHAGLGEGEREECSDGKERNEAIGDAPEGGQQQCGEADKGIDAMGVKEGAAASFKNMRKVVAFSDGTGKTGKVGERSIGRQRKDGEDGGNGNVVKPAASGDAEMSWERML